MKQSKKTNELGVYRFVYIPGATKSGVENMIRAGNCNPR